MADKRCIFLAMDGMASHSDLMKTVEIATKGPIAPYLAGIKLNDMLHTWESGPAVVSAICEKYPDLDVCLDLKLADVSLTSRNIIGHYDHFEGRLLVTVSIHSSVKVFTILREEFLALRVIAMGVPTDMTVAECKETYGLSPADAMVEWYSARARQFRHIIEPCVGYDYPTELAVMSFDMVELMQKNFPGLEAFTPGIRDAWMDKGHQERTVGIRQALELGVDYPVMGAQLIRGNPDGGISPFVSQSRTAAEIEWYLADIAATQSDNYAANDACRRTIPENGPEF